MPASDPLTDVSQEPSLETCQSGYDMDTYEADLKEATDALLTADKCTYLLTSWLKADSNSYAYLLSTDLKACDQSSNSSSPRDTSRTRRKKKNSSSQTPRVNLERRLSGPYLKMEGNCCHVIKH